MCTCLYKTQSWKRLTPYRAIQEQRPSNRRATTKSSDHSDTAIEELQPRAATIQIQPSKSYNREQQPSRYNHRRATTESSNHPDTAIEELQPRAATIQTQASKSYNREQRPSSASGKTESEHRQDSSHLGRAHPRDTATTSDHRRDTTDFESSDHRV